MKFKRNIQPRDFLRIQTCEVLERCKVLSDDERYEQARFAQAVRNCWFTATSFPIDIVTGAALTASPRAGYNPPFGEPVIITDVLSMLDFKINDPAIANWNNNTPRFLLSMREYGGDQSYGTDFYGLSSLLTSPQEFFTKHEKNRSQQFLGSLIPDTVGKYLEFVPRLLKPYQRIECKWLLNNNMPVPEVQLSPQIGFRAVRILKPDNPYSYFTTSTDRRIKRYISNSVPETFFLELQFPFANIPAAGLTMPAVKTEQMDRPLMILGSVCNLEGVQASLYDESKYYEFTTVDKRIKEPALQAPEYTAVPMSLWCPSSEFRNPNIYNMWPVPHLLEPGAQLRVTITNGLQPTTTGAWQLSAATRSSQAVRIVFLCRTV